MFCFVAVCPAMKLCFSYSNHLTAEKEKLLENSGYSASAELNGQSWVCAVAVRKMFSDVPRKAQERMYFWPGQP